MRRIIGIRHRWKDLAGSEGDDEGRKIEERPTRVTVSSGEGLKHYKLETETDELDFLLGRFVTRWRSLGDGESTGDIFARHIIVEEKKGKPTGRTLVPESYEGFRTHDVVLMTLGGSGDRFAYALSRHGEEIHAEVFRIEPGKLKNERDFIGGKKEDDPKLLINLFEKSPSLFQLCGPRDRDQIRVASALQARQSAQDARKATAQRLRQRLVGGIFLSDEGKYPEGKIEDVYKSAAANSVILKSNQREEHECDRKLKAVVTPLRVYREVFEPIEGCGHALAARIIASVGDIRRFPTKEKFKAFCGVHVLGSNFKKMPPGTVRTDGDSVMPRHRRGQVSDWNPTSRQAFFLLGDQFNRRPHTLWGKKLLEVKATFRAKYPEPLIGPNGKLRFTAGHIHKRAIWRTVTKFAEDLYRTWRRIEREAQGQADEPLKKTAHAVSVSAGT